MSASSRPHGSQYYQKTTNGPPYSTSPPLLQRSPPTHQSRTAVPPPYDGPIDLSRSSKPAIRPGTGPVAQPDEGSEDLSMIQDSPTDMHLGMGSPGIARRAKAHVPSACVNCKRKHLACETRRPCNRCLQAGKEATCVDVQHKKRGRPRLRDEETGRGSVTYGGESSHPQLYPAQAEILGLQGSDQRTQPRTLSYREIRSHPETMYASSRAPFHQSSNTGYTQPHDPLPASQSIPETTPIALLSLDFIIQRSNFTFSTALSLPSSVEGRSIKDLLISSDREKLQRLQNSLSAELQDKAHLPPLRSCPPGAPFDLLAATAGFQQRPEYLTFHLPNGQSRGFPVSISLARTTTSFLVLSLVATTKAPLTLSHVPNSHRGWTPALPSPVPAPSLRSPGLEYSAAPPMSLSYQSVPPPHQLVPQSPLPATIAAYRRSPPDVRTSPSAASTSTARSSMHGSGHGSGSSLHGSDVPNDRLRHLQLPPLRTSGISSTRMDKGSSKGSPSTKGSPQSSKRKKRRRVDIAEIS